jgi:uncharacterized phage protein (TIGR01671 family)
MREILFKAKQIDNGEWIEGSLIDLDIDSGYCYIVQPYKKASILPIIFLITDRMKLVDPETLCQFTGLCDKNGKKIWENDICDRKEKYPEVVKMTNGDWTLDYSYALGRDYGNSYCNLGFYVNERKCVEVIGNIFDNPELLQEESDE